MTNADKLDWAMRIFMGATLFVLASLVVLFVCLSIGINHWIGFAILALGYLVGRISRGIE